jgi:UDPglucose 6-dehydrogenase
VSTGKKVHGLSAPGSWLYVYSDGGSRGNPGPAGIGGQAKDGSGNLLLEVYEFLGEATSNVAEYHALIAILEACGGLGYDRVRVRTDSELLANQTTGAYKVKSKALRPLHYRVKGLLDGFQAVEVEHIPREKNNACDALANRAIDEGLSGVLKAVLQPGDEELFPAPAAGDGAAVSERRRRNGPVSSRTKMECCVIGTGYVGLVTGACLADLGHSVTCIDRDSEKIEALCQGNVPIFEAGLEVIVERQFASGNLRFTSDIQGAIASSEFIFVTVDAAAINGYKVIINKSTVPVGSTRRVERAIEEAMEEYREFDVVSNPEFLREGTAVSDFQKPARIVIGSDSQKAIMRMIELYRGIDAPLLVTDPVSAEMIKYASNAFLATKVSYINAIANICEAVGADVREVSLGMGYDERIGFEFLKAGPGFGGSCFPKDCRALLAISGDSGYDFNLLNGVLDVNREQQERVVMKVERVLGGLEDKRVAVLGLAFKANTDDIRESPAVNVTRMLLEKGAVVKAYDPQAMDNTREVLSGVEFIDDPYQVLKGADVICL